MEGNRYLVAVVVKVNDLDPAVCFLVPDDAERLVEPVVANVAVTLTGIAVRAVPCRGLPTLRFSLYALFNSSLRTHLITYVC